MVVLATVSAFAQENCKGPYLTNKAFDNTFVGIGGGINTLIHKDNENKITFDPEIFAGKWFTPNVGGRIGYQGLRLKEEYDADFHHHYYPEGSGTATGVQTLNHGFAYFHGDLMWNVCNQFGGYKDRFFNLIPYAHCGYVRIYDPSKGFFSDAQDNEFAAGPGIMGTFRITEHLAAMLDVCDVIFSGRFHDYNEGSAVNTVSASIGVMYKIGKTGWDCGDNGASLAAVTDALAAAEAALAAARKDLAAANQNLLDANAENDALKKRIKALEDELNKEPEKDVVYIKTALGVAPITLFYELDKDALNVTELRHLDDYVTSILEQDADRTFVLTGSADKGTGSYKHNVDLAGRRAAGVKKILMEKYKVKADKIVVSDPKVSDENIDPRLDRSVVVKH